MDDLLKKLAALDDATLSIYITADPNYKKPRKPRTRRPKETPEDQQSVQELLPSPVKPPSRPHFDFDDFARQYESVCEADFALSKMTEKELEEFGYCETESDSDVEGGYFNTDMLKTDSEIRNDWRESFFRTERCKENAPNRLTTKYVDLFDTRALKNLFASYLRSSPDDVVKAKLKRYAPLITNKCFFELYSGVKGHVKNHLHMTEALFSEMRSIWSRARPYFPLSDLASDFRRLRKLKRKQPDCSFQDIKNGFAVRNEVHEFIDKADVHVAIVREAEKRIGADKYGPTVHFANLIDETNLSEEEQMIECFSDNEEPVPIVSDNVVDNVLSDNTTLDTTTDQQPSSPELSKKDIAKLHRAIKKALKSKLRK